MPFMEIGVFLYLDGYELAGGYYENENATYVTTNAAAPCVLPGAYQGGVVGYVVAPPGFVPPASNWGGEEFFGPPEYLVC